MPALIIIIAAIFGLVTMSYAGTEQHPFLIITSIIAFLVVLLLIWYIFAMKIAEYKKK